MVNNRVIDQDVLFGNFVPEELLSEIYHRIFVSLIIDFEF